MAVNFTIDYFDTEVLCYLSGGQDAGVTYPRSVNFKAEYFLFFADGRKQILDGVDIEKQYDLSRNNLSRYYLSYTITKLILPSQVSEIDYEYIEGHIYISCGTSTTSQDIKINRRARLKIENIQPLIIPFGSNGNIYSLTSSDFNRMISANGDYRSIKYRLKTEDEFSTLSSTANFNIGEKYVVCLTDSTNHDTEEYEVTLVIKNTKLELNWNSYIEDSNLIGFSVNAISDRDCTVTLNSKNKGRINSQNLKSGDSLDLSVDLTLFERNTSDEYFVIITDSIETFPKVYYKYNGEQTIDTLPDPELDYIKNYDDDSNDDSNDDMNKKINDDIFGGRLYYNISNLYHGIPYFIFSYLNQTYKVKAEKNENGYFYTDLFKGKTGTIKVQVIVEDPNYSYFLGIEEYELITFQTFGNSLVFDENKNRTDLHLLKDDEKLQALTLQMAKIIFDDEYAESKWKKYGILPEKTKLYVKNGDIYTEIATSVEFSVDGEYLKVTFRNTNLLATSLKNVFSNQNIDYNVKLLMQLENVFGDTYYATEADILFVFREGIERIDKKALTITNKNTYNQSFRILEEGDKIVFSQKFKSYNTTPIKMWIQLKRSSSSKADGTSYVTYSKTLTVTPTIGENNTFSVEVTVPRINESKYLFFRLRYTNPYTGINETLGGYNLDTSTYQYRSLKKLTPTSTIEYIELKKDEDSTTYVDFKLASTYPKKAIEVIGGIPSGFAKTSYYFVPTIDNDQIEDQKSFTELPRSSYYPSKDSWQKIRFDYYIRAEYNEKAYSYCFCSSEIYNITPTVSYRKNLLGINTRQIDDDNLTENTLMLIGEVDGRNEIKFIPLDTGFCKISGFLFDCGTWD